MATLNKFNCFVEDLAEKKHNLGADVLKICLTNSAPVATNTVYANITDLTTGGGYTAGGTAATITSSAQTTGTYKLVLADVVFTATTGFGPFRYAVLYNDTDATKPLIGWADYASSISLLALETFTADFDPTNGVLTIV
jgi:hypothetical protein